jgi:hypothetical protein
MKAADLKAIWEAPDNSRLMKNQTSVRLSTHVGARISAICELYPTKSKSQVINDLLAAALDEFEKSFEFIPGREVGEDPGTREVFAEDVGPRVRFINTANRHLKEIEAELGNSDPVLLDPVWVDVKK